MNKRMTSLIIALTIIFSAAFSTSALAETVEVTDTSEHLSTITVSAVVGSSYSVSIPANFALEKQVSPVTYNATDYDYYYQYAVGAKGNIPVGKHISITPGSLTLADQDGAGSNTVPVTIVQTKTTWARSDLLDGGVIKNDYTMTNGQAYANIMFAGSYSGSLTYTFGLEDD